ncbi:hypothetical protein BHE74_00001165 [Ensete ventricosum]|nr:hypothetical protein BHE74_00001165 [Ensete ventricosum]
MAANALQSSTPMKTPNPKNHSSASRRAPPPNQMDSSVSAVADFKSRFEAYNRLQAAAVAFGERLPIPEIVALGGQSDGKSSLLEALLGFRFNVREVEMGTRRPLVLQMVHDPSALEPRCRFQPESTPTEILSMVKSLASPPHRLLLFLQQSSVEWCSSLWLDAIREIDPTFKRTIIVVSKFDNRLKVSAEFTERWEVDNYLSANGYLGENIRPYFVALPKDRGAVTNEEFRRQISQVDAEVLRHLRDSVNGGFDEEKYRPYVGFSCLRQYLESELQRRYKEAAPATLALLEQRCNEVSIELARLESKLQATSDVALIDGASDPAPEEWGKTTDEERSDSGIGSWPGVTVAVKPPNHTLKLYGGAAFERAMHEFQCATYSIECPLVSREKVANILLAHAGRGGCGGFTEAAAEIARAAARAWLAPLLDAACERLSFVLRSLFDLALERNRSHDSDRTFNQLSAASFLLDLSDATDEMVADQENIPPPKDQQHSTPGKETEAKDAGLREIQMTVPETPSPDQPQEFYGVKKDTVNLMDIGGRKRQARIITSGRNVEANRNQNSSILFGAGNKGSTTGSSYAEICSMSAQHFARIRQVLIERNIPSALSAGFLTPWLEAVRCAWPSAVRCERREVHGHVCGAGGDRCPSRREAVTQQAPKDLAIVFERVQEHRPGTMSAVLAGAEAALDLEDEMIDSLLMEERHLWRCNRRWWC